MPLLIPGFCLSPRFLLWGLGRSPGFACMRCASLQPFWHPALASQAPPAIILAVLRRFRGSALLRGLCPSSSQGAPFWPSGLTLRSSGLAFSQPLTLAVSPTPALCAPPLVPALGPVPKAFKLFWPPALVQQAPAAILLAALRRFRGPALFHGPRTSSRLGAPFWPSGLTLRSSGPAFCGPLTLAVSLLFIPAHFSP